MHKKFIHFILLGMTLYVLDLIEIFDENTFIYLSNLLYYDKIKLRCIVWLF